MFILGHHVNSLFHIDYFIVWMSRGKNYGKPVGIYKLDDVSMEMYRLKTTS